MRLFSFSVLFLLWLAWSIPSNCQDTQIKGFSDGQFGLVKSDSSIDKGKNHGFALGQFDLYITSQVSDRINFLAETVFEWAPEENTWALDVERIIIKYTIKDYFSISTGKFHTPFGYWNNAYHHGALIQPTINRPVIVRFEDNGGYLPVHQVGLLFSGTAISSKNFGYNFFISNGQSQGNTGGTFDYNRAALSGNLSLEPVENLHLLVSAYSTDVPTGATTFQGITLAEDSKYNLLNASVAYFNPLSRVEFATEYYHITNKMTTKSASNAFFAYLGLNATQKITPYVLYNKVTFESSESYFEQNDIDEFTAGIRFKLAQKSMLKLEYTHNQSGLYASSNLFQTQFAIGF